ncbi:hypothetical protein FJZ53_03045 [Candidatus Woesearchaeota archaeon]|nr:hypothetical protein [Candidatus Woesearchaeota archaeon]
MYKREIKIQGKQYSYYYHNIKVKGKVKNIFLGSDLEKAKEKLAKLNDQEKTFSILKFLRISNKHAFVLFLIFLACLAYSLSAQIEQPATSYANITFNGTNTSDNFGNSLTTGDVNGDGLKDIIIGASNAGQVFVFFGADYSTTINENAFSYANLTFNATGGSHVASGDINNDSFSDVIIGTGSTQAFVIFGAQYPDMYVNQNASLYANLTFNSTGNSAFGFSVAAGDVNNDNYTDIVIGNTNANIYGSTDGQVFVLFGADYSTTINENAFSYANITLNATTDVGEEFGYSVASGDVNNDGYSDIIAGARSADPLGDSTYGGQAYVFFGAAYTDRVNEKSLQYANITINGTSDDGADKWLGSSVASGKINNDNFYDITIGSMYGDPSGNSDAGQVFVFFGANYNSPVSYDSLSSANITINGTSSSGYLGSTETVSNGDINCDGSADISIGAPSASVDDTITLGGRVFVFFGSDYTSAVNQNDFSYSNITINGTEGLDEDGNVGSQLGTSIASGDIDNDGCAELITSAPYANTSLNNWAGQVYVLDFSEGAGSDSLAPVVTLDSPGDLNSITSATSFKYTATDSSGLDTCELWGNWTGVWHLNETFVSPTSGSQNESSTLTFEAGNYLWNVWCNDTVGNSGFSAANYTLIVDPNTPTVVLNSPTDFYNETATGGVVFNYTASSGGAVDTCELWGDWSGGWHLNETFVSPTASVTNGSSNITIADGQYLWSVYCNSTLGNRNTTVQNFTLNVDLNPPTVVLNSPIDFYNETTVNTVLFNFTATDSLGLGTCELWGNWSGGWHLNKSFSGLTSGVSQSTVVDMPNGLYIWAVYCYDSANNYNSTVGTFTLDINVPFAILLTKIDGKVADDQLGWTFATGDVNGDGYKDLIAGDSNADPPSPVGATNSGQVFVFFGAPNNGITDMDATYANITINGTSALVGLHNHADGLGWDVASGDINNDGYDDIIVGSKAASPPSSYDSGFQTDDSSGQVLVFYGASFTSTINEQSGSYANITLNGTAESRLGESVAVGDVNNDNYDDIIVGSPNARHSAPINTAGQVSVLFGANFGTISMSEFNSYANITLNATESSMDLGSDVGSGDINDDGYADILVGARYADTPAVNNAGQVLVYFGAAYTSAINEKYSSYANFTINGSAWDQLGDYRSLHTGDVNNDGYSDIIIGVGTQGTYEGQAYVFFGAAYNDGSAINGFPGPAGLGAGSYANITINGTYPEEFGSGIDVGDFNNDGYADLAVGGYDGAVTLPNGSIGISGTGNGDGAVYLFFGENYTSAINQNASLLANITINATMAGEVFGWNVDVGDINDDDYADIMVGAPYSAPSGKNRAGRTYIYSSDYIPRVNLNTPLNARIDTDGQVYFNYTAIDINLDTCWLTINGELNATNVTNERYANFSVGLTEGRYNWSVSCNDTFNNVNTSELWDLSIIFIEGGDGNTTNLENEENSSNVSGYIYEVSTLGMINFTDEILDLSNGSNMTGYMVVSNNNITIDIEGLMSDFGVDLNKSAVLSFYGLTFSNPRILRDGTLCPADVCTKLSYSGGVLEFNVTGFSSYTSEETPAAVEETPTSGGTTSTDYTYPSETEIIPKPIPEPVVPEVPIEEEEEEMPPALEVPSDFITPLDLDTPEEVIPEGGADYIDEVVNTAKVDNDLITSVSGDRGGAREELEVHALSVKNKPVYVINMDTKECDHNCPNCYNGVKDSDEEGVDCGGSCALNCQGVENIPRILFVCGDSQCSTGEECFCAEDCGRLECLKLTYDKDLVIVLLGSLFFVAMLSLLMLNIERKHKPIISTMKLRRVGR